MDMSSCRLKFQHNKRSAISKNAPSRFQTHPATLSIRLRNSTDQQMLDINLGLAGLLKGKVVILQSFSEQITTQLRIHMVAPPSLVQLKKPWHALSKLSKVNLSQYLALEIIQVG